MGIGALIRGLILSNWGGIGVEIFLLISGYLYANKKIDSEKNWLIGRCKRILIPLWTTVVIYIIMCAAINHTFAGTPLLLYIFNIQGVNRIFYNLSYCTVAGLAQTWFLTILFVSYFLMLALKKQKTMEYWIDNHKLVSMILAIFVQAAVAYIGVQLSYILQFFIGYFLGRHISKNKEIEKKNILIFALVAIALTGVRLVLRNSIDGSILYDRVIARLSFNFLTLTACCIVIHLESIYADFFNRIVTSRKWLVLDSLSFPLYLSHYMLLQGDLSISRYTIDTSIIEFLIFMICTILLGLIIFCINKCLIKSLRGA